MRTESPDPERPKLLVVDDDLANARTLARLFEQRYRVLVASDGATALQVAEAAEPDVIVLDVVMPDMDGYEVCRRLKSSPGTEDIPVIMVTGMDAGEAEGRALELGAADFVTKPLNPLVLEKRVQIQTDL